MSTTTTKKYAMCFVVQNGICHLSEKKLLYFKISCNNRSVGVRCLERYGGGRTHRGDNFGLDLTEERGGLPSDSAHMRG